MNHDGLIRTFLVSKADALVARNAAFFEQSLHLDFVYLNTRGIRFDKRSYIDQFSVVGKSKFLSQKIDDIQISVFETFAVATMNVDDTFETESGKSAYRFKSLCVFCFQDSKCLWVAGQTMLPQS